MRIGLLNQRISFERKYSTRDPNYGTEVVKWDTVATVWASVNEQNANEQVGSNVRTSTRSVNVRCRWVPNITSDMRVRDIGSNRVYQIVSLAEMRKRLGLNLVIEEYSV